VTAGVRDRARTIRIEGRISRWSIIIGRGSAARRVVPFILIIAVPVLGALVFTTSHTHVASDTDTATLLSDHAAQSSALTEARELLRRKDGEGCRLHLRAMSYKVVAVVDDVWVLGVQILHLAQILEERSSGTFPRGGLTDQGR
jgi:hypothetical protein